MAGRPMRSGKAKALPAIRRLATTRQLWRLNEQGLLRVVDLDDETFRPGGPVDGWLGVSAAEADVLLGRALEERWRGLPAFPRKGELWTVRDGRVVSLGMALDEEAS